MKTRRTSQRGHELAIDRTVGHTPEQRLRWAVETFLRLDLEQEIPEAIAAIGVYLKAFGPRPNRRGDVVMAAALPEGVSADQVGRIHRRFREGLVDFRRHGEWDVPTPSRRALIALSGGASPAWLHEYDNPEDAIVAGLAEVTQTESARLQECPECRRLFVRNRKQQYCSAPCSMARRNRNRSRPRRRRPSAKKGA